MTEAEATKVLDGLRQTVRTLNPMAARQAFNALMTDPRVFTTAKRRAAEAGEAVQTLIRAFDEISGAAFGFRQINDTTCSLDRYFFRKNLRLGAARDD